ncbi:MAG: TraM recognition domain-containing protein [Alphaproteobacteria bacterium]
MTVFDEVGYYTAQGMAVMAAQARSLGFCLVFSGQDIPAMKKRVREEANSILANCNIKIFGKLEDPTETKEFFEKTVGSAIVTEVSGYQVSGGGRSYFDTKQAGVQLRPRASYDGLRNFKEGEAVITFGAAVMDCNMFYSNPGHAKAMRVTRYMALPPPDDEIVKHAKEITALRDLMVSKTWSAERADVAAPMLEEIEALVKGYNLADKPGPDPISAGIAALIEVYGLTNRIEAPAEEPKSAEPQAPATPPPSPLAAKPSLPAKTATLPAEGGNPLSFFTGKKSEGAAAPASALPSAKPATPPPAAKAPELPREIRTIIEDAAQSMKKALFKDEKDKDDIDAAE